MSDYEINPPWVDRVLTKNFNSILDKVGIDHMPTPDAIGSVWKELGCGHYGCVLETGDPKVVFKVTSDPSEAKFVSAMMTIPESDRPNGIVHYYFVAHIPDETYKNRPIYVIVRESASGIGKLDEIAFKFGDRKFKSVANHLYVFQRFAAIARDKIHGSPVNVAKVEDLAKWAEDTVEWSKIEMALNSKYDTPPSFKSIYTGSRAAAYAVQCAKITALDMVNEDVGYLIGETLAYYLEEGMLLADVHTGNVGQVRREGYANPMWVITDPGHMVPIQRKWTDIQVPQI